MARCGSVSCSTVSLSRSRCAWLSAGRTTAFQPAGSACAEVSEARSAAETAESEPTSGAHSSSSSVTVSVSGSVSSALASSLHRDAVPHRSAASVLSYSV